jgi:hypothetical protein
MTKETSIARNLHRELGERTRERHVALAQDALTREAAGLGRETSDERLYSRLRGGYGDHARYLD